MRKRLSALIKLDVSRDSIILYGRPNVRERWVGREANIRKVSHVLSRKRRPKPSANDALVNEAAHFPFTINDPEASCVYCTFCVEASLVVSLFMVMSYNQGCLVISWNDHRIFFRCD